MSQPYRLYNATVTLANGNTFTSRINARTEQGVKDYYLITVGYITEEDYTTGKESRVKITAVDVTD